MKLILFAQTSEAKATLAKLNARPEPGHTANIYSEGAVPTLYRYDEGYIAITNMGLHAAACAVAKYSHLCDQIWNIGFAGALHPNLELCQIVSISHVGKYVPLSDEELEHPSNLCVKETLPDVPLQEEGISLVSSDFPIHDHLHRSHLLKSYALVDMEGYAIAHLAKALGKKCHIWKIVSDFASPGGRELIRQNKEKLSEQIAEHIIHESSRFI